MAENKYLDKAGVEQLWKAVVARDNGIKLSYSGNSIKLTGLNDEDLGSIDASPFIKDGMLSDVSIVVSAPDLPVQYDEKSYTDGTKFIKFTWNAAAGDKTDFIKLDEIGAVYTGTDSIDISTANKISVKNVGADKTTTSADIPVAGGPLAKLLNEAGINSIEANTNIQDVLMKLLCKELFADAISSSNATLVSTVEAPTISMSTSTVEVGTPVHYTVTNGASSYTATPHKVTGLKYGYSTTDNDTKEHVETEIQSNFGVITPDTDITTLTVSGAASASKNGTAGAATAELTGNIIAIEGTNTLNASNTSATYNGTCEVLEPVYACSNLGNTDSSHVSERKEISILTSEPVSNSNSKSFQGKYKYFIGVYPTVYSETEYNSDFIRNTAKSSDWMNGTSVNITVSTEVGTKGMYIAIPEGIDNEGANLHVVQTTALNNDASKDIAKNVKTISVKCGGDHTKNYKVFTWDFPGGTEGIEKFDITKF